MMPRGVSTRWNSSYDMLKFAIEYRLAIDKMAKEKQLRAFELDEQEWETISELCEVLKVCLSFRLYIGRSFQR
jgi:hypothetical protein